MPAPVAEPLPVAQVLSLVEQAWRVMKDSNDTALPMTHSGYVKLYQLSRPDLSRAYDVIMLDEAQDVSPAIGDVILRQKAPRVLCGDSHQAIYSFIGRPTLPSFVIRGFPIRWVWIDKTRPLLI
jgi:hypothetical protein